MPRDDYKTCKTCGRHRDECGSLSRTRQCSDCWGVALRENMDGIATHTGPAFARWRRAMAASVGAVLLDDVQAKP